MIDTEGQVIDGLYAAGNTTASVTGHRYPGPGSTIGPAMIFGYLAACHLADRAAGADEAPGAVADRKPAASQGGR